MRVRANNASGGGGGTRTLKQELSSRFSKASGTSTLSITGLLNKPSGTFTLLTSSTTQLIFNPSTSNPNHGILECYTNNARATGSDREVDVTFGDDSIEISAFVWATSAQYFYCINYYEV